MVDKTSATRDVSQEVWEAMGGTGPSPVSPVEKPQVQTPPQPLPTAPKSISQTKDVTQINRGSSPPPGWKVSGQYTSTQETGTIYEDEQGKTHIRVGINPAGQVYMELEKAKTGAQYTDPIILERLRKEEPYLYTQYIEKGEKGIKEAIKQRQEKITEIVKKQEIKLEDYLNKLRKDDPYLYGVYKKDGINGLNKAIQKRQSDIEAINVRSQAKYKAEVAKFESDLQKTNPKWYKAYKDGGIEAYLAISGYDESAYKNAMSKIKNYIDKDGNINIADYLMKNKDKKPLYDLGVTNSDIKIAEKYNAYNMGVGEYTKRYFEDKGWGSIEIPWAEVGSKVTQKEINTFQNRVKEAQKEYYNLVPEKKPTTLLKEVGLSMIPVYGTYRYYNIAKQDGLSGGEIGMLAGSALADLLFVIPAIGQISAGARGTFTAGKIGGLYGATMAAKDVAIAEIKAPFTVLTHPVQTFKSVGGSVETVFRRIKVPLSSYESYYSTTRLPIKLIGNAKDAKKLQDAVTQSLIEGKASKVTINNQTVNLRPTEINKLGEPVAVHATPDIRPFMDGAELDGLYVSPRGASRFSIADSHGFAPKDGIRGALIIRDEKALKSLLSSNKTYKGTAEVERVLENYNLGKPVQTLVSRLPSGDKLTLLVFGKQFSNKELAKMKFFGSLDTVKQIFTKDIKVSGPARQYDDVSDLVNQVDDLKIRIKNARTPKERYKLEQSLKRLKVRIKRDYSRAIRSYKKARLTPSLMMINYRGGILDKYRRALNIRRNTGTAIPRRLPPINIEGRLPPTKTELRKVPTPPKTRIPPTPPEIRIPPTTTELRKVPTPPKTRIPPTPPEIRKLPTPPEIRKPPTPPEIRKPPTPPEIRKPPTPPPKKGKKQLEGQEKKKRQVIKKSLGAVTYRRGELNNEGVWHTYHIDKNGILKRSIVVGPPPEGATVATGEGSTTTTLKLIRGKKVPNFTILADTGAVDDLISASNGKLTLTHVPDRISGGGMKRISNGIGRLSPKTPKLR